jgi:hypothetical protein
MIFYEFLKCFPIASRDVISFPFKWENEPVNITKIRNLKDDIKPL